jgi:hypothetical protein
MLRDIDDQHWPKNRTRIDDLLEWFEIQVVPLLNELQAFAGKKTSCLMPAGLPKHNEDIQDEERKI